MNATEFDFSSPQDLEQVLESIGLKIHSKNRIAGGESNFLWHLAETVRKAGRLAEQWEDDELRAQYGDGYNAGKIPEAKQQAAFLKLLAGQSTDRRKW